MMNRTLIGWRSASGGSPFAISIAVIPRDQISACIKQRLTYGNCSKDQLPKIKALENYVDINADKKN